MILNNNYINIQAYRLVIFVKWLSRVQMQLANVTAMLIIIQYNVQRVLTSKQLDLPLVSRKLLTEDKTRSQAVARIADRTASQQTLVPN